MVEFLFSHCRVSTSFATKQSWSFWYLLIHMPTSSEEGYDILVYIFAAILNTIHPLK